MSDPLLWDKRQAAEAIGVSVTTLDRLCRDADDPLPHLKLGRFVRFRPADLEAWIARKVKGGQPND